MNVCYLLKTDNSIPAIYQYCQNALALDTQSAGHTGPPVIQVPRTFLRSDTSRTRIQILAISESRHRGPRWCRSKRVEEDFTLYSIRGKRYLLVEIASVRKTLGSTRQLESNLHRFGRIDILTEEMLIHGYYII